MRTLLYIAICGSFAGVAYQWTWQYYGIIMLWIAIAVTIRWTLFDYLLNLMRRKPLYYLGSETIGDIIESRFNEVALFVIKMTILIAVALSIIVI
jgi:hypothetical protein